MSGRSPRPDFGRTDYRFKINDNFGMLHETTLRVRFPVLDKSQETMYTWFCAAGEIAVPCTCNPLQQG